MILVTGGAGFIGSNLVRALNARGMSDIVVADDLRPVDGVADKTANLYDLEFTDYLDRDELARLLPSRDALGALDAVFHLGACSDTMIADARYMMEANFTYSKLLYRYCVAARVPLVYASSASVYGAGPGFSERPEHERPLNVYALSKLAFDRFVGAAAPAPVPVSGLRYFNVYGDRESHKGRMASVAWHFFRQYRDTGTVRLFEGSDGYGPGEQRRDFVSVEDAVTATLHVLDVGVSGVFNVGTGRSQTFNDVAAAVINRCRRDEGVGAEEAGSLASSGAIEYVSFPPELVGKYQSFTEADLRALRGSGYTGRWLDVEEGVGRYVGRLLAGKPNDFLEAGTGAGAG